jgi:hypothetical protein
MVKPFAPFAPIATALALALGAGVAAAGSAGAGAGLAVIGRSGDSITFKLPGGSGVTLDGRWRAAGTGRWRSVRLGRARRWRVAGLTAATGYLFELRSCRRNRCAAWSRALRESTLQPPAPVTGTAMPVTCRIFPSSNDWNKDVSQLPLDPNSDAYIASIGANGHLHPDVGSDPGYGLPYTVVGPTQPLVPITWTAYGDQSDGHAYPVPPNAPVEAGSDRHVIVVQNGTCKLYELYNARRNTQGGWNADSGAIFDLSRNALRPDGWTSADAAGLPIFAGLIRYDEIQSGHIDHALRFTVARTQRGYIHPATHFASSSSDASLPPMGLRLRLKAGYDIAGFHGAALVILKALRRYGMIVADNGSNWYISGATDPRFNDDDLNQLKSVPGSAFEVVQTGQILRRS